MVALIAIRKGSGKGYLLPFVSDEGVKTVIINADAIIRVVRIEGDLESGG